MSLTQRTRFQLSLLVLAEVQPACSIDQPGALVILSSDANAFGAS